MKLRRAVLPALAVLLVLAGCGAPPADLFVISRTGNVAGASFRLLASDGTVRCNGGPEREISSAQVLTARAIATDLVDVKQSQIPVTPARIYRFRVRYEQGELSFSDTTTRPAILPKLVAYTLQIGRSVCHVR
jgi:hypothetical protein